MCPEDVRALLILAHGAGADFQHRNMLDIATALADARVATLRFNFPFMQQGRRRVDSRDVSIATIGAAVATAEEVAAGVPLYLGGHSFGGRMASHAAAEARLPVRGLVFCAFPLHPPNKPGVERAAHLAAIELPMQFLSGTRDALAQPELLSGVVEELAPRAHLHWLDTADHSYRTLKRQRAAEEGVFAEMARVIAAFIEAQAD